MRAGGCDAFRKEPSCGRFPRFRLADHALRTGPAGEDRGADGALQIDGDVVPCGAQVPPCIHYRAQRRRRKRPPGPGLGGSQVDAVDQRALRAAAGAGVGNVGGQQSPPLRLDRPADRPVRVCASKRGHGRERVQNVAHRTQANDQNTKGVGASRRALGSMEQTLFSHSKQAGLSQEAAPGARP